MVCDFAIIKLIFETNYDHFKSTNAQKVCFLQESNSGRANECDNLSVSTIFNHFRLKISQNFVRLIACRSSLPHLA